MISKDWSRRTFVKAAGVTGVGMAIGLPTRNRRSHVFPMDVPRAGGMLTVRDPRVKALALRTLDAARGAGAQYADVRMTMTRHMLGMSVRVLRDGCWGFASSPYLAEDEGPRIGREAVHLALSIIKKGKPRTVDWTPVPVLPDGDWTTPITIDPESVAAEEIKDWVWGMINWGTARGFKFLNPEQNVQAYGSREERLFASTEGSFLTQTVYTMDGHIRGSYRDIGVHVDEFCGVTAGWEYVVNNSAAWRDALLRRREEIDEELKLPEKIIDIGRYDVVLDHNVVRTLLMRTLGTATQVDRALGYEANLGGTSYLGPDPLALLGTSVASPLVTVTAERSAPLGLATVQWDEEGVAPSPFTLIKDGVLVDYQTTREQAPWLAPWYAKHGIAVQSHGCAAAPSGDLLAMQHAPNLTLQPGTGPGTADLSFDDLVAGMSKGLAMCDGVRETQIDQQCLNGMGLPMRLYEIKGGKRIARIRLQAEGAGWRPLLAIVFRSPEIWKNILAIGGPKSRMMGTDWDAKGVPVQRERCTVNTVPMVAKQVAFIDPLRKA